MFRYWFISAAPSSLHSSNTTSFFARLSVSVYPVNGFYVTVCCRNHSDKWLRDSYACRPSSCRPSNLILPPSCSPHCRRIWLQWVTHVSLCWTNLNVISSHVLRWGIPHIFARHTSISLILDCCRWSTYGSADILPGLHIFWFGRRTSPGLGYLRYSLLCVSHCILTISTILHAANLCYLPGSLFWPV